MLKRKKSQIWIETMLYTLIALSLIATALSFLTPKIQEIQDKETIEQTKNLLNKVDSIIFDIDRKGVGNKRKIQTSIDDGELTINTVEDRLNFELEGNSMYSEPGATLNEGRLLIKTTKTNNTDNPYAVNLTLDYTDKYNITYNNKETKKVLEKSNADYVMYITNKGGSDKKIDFSTI